MKTNPGKALLLFFAIAVIAGCSKSDDATTTTAPANPYGGNNGQVTFWCSNVNASVFPVTVTVNGQYVGTIGHAITTAPDCNNQNDGVVKFIGAPGTYNTYCTAHSGGNWTGTVTITGTSCILEQLQ